MVALRTGDFRGLESEWVVPIILKVAELTESAACRRGKTFHLSLSLNLLHNELALGKVAAVCARGPDQAAVMRVLVNALIRV